MSSWFSDSDPSIWFIRKLGIELDLSLGWDAERVGRAWANQLARKLSHDLKEDGNGVVRFPSRAAYLAQFLVDLKKGWAWGKWYYRDFEGLRMLPLSAALRTALAARQQTAYPLF